MNANDVPLKLIRFKETWGNFASSGELEVIADDDKFRIRVRESFGKASVFLSRKELIDLRHALGRMLESTADNFTKEK